MNKMVPGAVRGPHQPPVEHAVSVFTYEAGDVVLALYPAIGRNDLTDGNPALHSAIQHAARAACKHCV